MTNGKVMAKGKVTVEEKEKPLRTIDIVKYRWSNVPSFTWKKSRNDKIELFAKDKKKIASITSSSSDLISAFILSSDDVKHLLARIEFLESQLRNIAESKWMGPSFDAAGIAKAALNQGYTSSGNHDAHR